MTALIRRALAADLAGIVTLLADDPLSGGREAPTLPPIENYHRACAAIDRVPNQLLATDRRV
ncbi:MAG: hypothetical protein ACRBC3_22935 [Burkholderiaceae bacterium]